MNVVLIAILGLLALSSYASAIVCLPSFCDDMKCQAVTAENCNGKVVPNGGFCGCCDACRAILKKGEYCGTELTLGLPPVAECGTGLVCSFATSRCE